LSGNVWTLLLGRAKLFEDRLRLRLENRWLRRGLQAAVVLICLAYLGVNLRNAGSQLGALQIDIGRLGAAWLLTTLAVYLGGLGWWLTLRGLGQKALLAPSLRAHLLSNLAKYMPGFAWQLVGKAYLAQKMGLSRRAAGVGMALEIAQLILTGLALAAVLLPEELVRNWPVTAGLEVVTLRITGLVAFAVLPVAAAGFLAWRWRDQAGVQLRPLVVGAATLVILLSWLLFGYAFWWIGTSLGPLPAADLPLFIFTLAASFLLGLAIVIVPGSLGVRESIMVFLLGSAHLPSALAVVIAGLSRVIVILSELAGALFFEAFLRIPGYSKSISEPSGDDQEAG
jgi:glycosyltransferase 2 family protein